MPNSPITFSPSPGYINPADLMFGTGNFDLSSAGTPDVSGIDFGKLTSPGPLGSGTGSDLGFNLNTGKLALAGLQTIGGLWNAFQANKLAKKQYQFQKDFANENLANQIQSYNTNLADKERSRAVMEGQSADQAQSYIDANSLKYKAL